MFSQQWYIFWLWKGIAVFCDQKYSINSPFICIFGKMLQIWSNETAVWPVYDVKWVLFKLIFCPLKMLACPWPLQCSIPHVRAFRWGTLWHLTSWSIKINKSLSLKITKSLLLLSKVESLNLQVVAVLMPLVIKHHTVPHLKGLNSGLEP